ncbi:MAG: hypothetical protein PHD95_00225 [Candidatus ainarchaeum sp.]|nr:hypothetical protein [Candidatus ainarchaeum sp.]
MHNLDLKLDSSQLKDIWVMLSQSCDHKCRNCFEATEKGIDSSKDNLSAKEILKLINEAIELGINEVGIPGA